MNFKIWLEYEDEELKQAAAAQGFHTNPVFHRSTQTFNQFDIKKASPSAIMGPAFYFSTKEGRWSISGEKNLNKPFFVKGNLLDITKPLDKQDIFKISMLIGRTIEAVPIITLENKFVSVAKGLEQAGYDGVWHRGPKNTKDLAMFKPNYIKLATNTLDDEGNEIPISERFDVSKDDIRY